MYSNLMNGISKIALIRKEYVFDIGNTHKGKINMSKYIFKNRFGG